MNLFVPSELSVLQMFSFNSLHHSERFHSLSGDNNSKAGEGYELAQDHPAEIHTQVL